MPATEIEKRRLSKYVVRFDWNLIVAHPLMNLSQATFYRHALQLPLIRKHTYVFSPSWRGRAKTLLLNNFFSVLETKRRVESFYPVNNCFLILILDVEILFFSNTYLRRKSRWIDLKSHSSAVPTKVHIHTKSVRMYVRNGILSTARSFMIRVDLLIDNLFIYLFVVVLLYTFEPNSATFVRCVSRARMLQIEFCTLYIT